MQTPFSGRLSEGTGNPPSEGQLPLRKIEAPRNGIDLDINPDLLPPPSPSSLLAGPRRPLLLKETFTSRIRLAGNQTRSLKPLQTAQQSPDSPHASPQGLQPTSTASIPHPPFPRPPCLQDLSTSHPHNLDTSLKDLRPPTTLRLEANALGRVAQSLRCPPSEECGGFLSSGTQPVPCTPGPPDQSPGPRRPPG